MTSRRWFDPGLAVLVFAVAMVELLLSHGRPLDGLALAAIVAPLVWRRRAPLPAASVAVVVGFALIASLPDLRALNTTTFLLFLPPFAVAAYEPRGRAVAGLAVCLLAPVAFNLTDHQGAGSWLFATAMCGASWATGRTLRARRAMAENLRAEARRMTAERQSRDRLVLVEERSRITRQLQAVVASRVSAIVVHAEVADRLLDDDPERADEAMACIEATGRQALSEMRHILGILRRSDEAPELVPQRGVGQIPALVDEARANRRQVVLQVEGEPSPLPPTVDLGLYRILEDALAGGRDGEAIAVVLRFGDSDVELEVTPAAGARLHWPTLAMRERVALCDGRLDVRTGLRVWMPRAFDGALA